jgi:hypothetical protein
MITKNKCHVFRIITTEAGIGVNTGNMCISSFRIVTIQAIIRINAGNTCILSRTYITLKGQHTLLYFSRSKELIKFRSFMDK